MTIIFALALCFFYIILLYVLFINYISILLIIIYFILLLWWMMIDYDDNLSPRIRGLPAPAHALHVKMSFFYAHTLFCNTNFAR